MQSGFAFRVSLSSLLSLLLIGCSASNDPLSATSKSPTTNARVQPPPPPPPTNSISDTSDDASADIALENAAEPESGGSHAAGPKRLLPAPEETCVQFMLALLKGNKREIEKLILPNPESDVLLKSKPLPDFLLAEAEKDLRGIPFKRLTPGETVKISDNETRVLRAEEIDDNHLFIADPRKPTPFILVRVNGTWKIDARPIIAARKGMVD
jgi:hypothetical protein